MLVRRPIRCRYQNRRRLRLASVNSTPGSRSIRWPGTFSADRGRVSCIRTSVAEGRFKVLEPHASWVVPLGGRTEGLQGAASTFAVVRE